MQRFGPDPRTFFASVYDTDAPWDIGGPQPALVQLISEFPLEEPVLDVGSGSGDLAIWIAKNGTKVVGLDFVPAAVALAQKRAESSRITRIDAEFAEENLMDQSLCSECGGPLAEGQTCRSLFDALLALEWQIPGGPGELADFRA